MVGFVTTSNALTALVYYLAKNPLIQEKVVNEVLNKFDNKNNEEICEKISKLDYLEACIMESLRICPPITGKSHDKIFRVSYGLLNYPYFSHTKELL